MSMSMCINEVSAIHLHVAYGIVIRATGLACLCCLAAFCSLSSKSLLLAEISGQSTLSTKRICGVHIYTLNLSCFTSYCDYV